MTTDEVNYCLHCGTKLERSHRIGAIRPVCPRCDWVYFPDPKVAVSVLIEMDAQVLLVRRSMSPQRGRWTLPGGFLDAGEDPKHAAERECFEETGLRVSVTGLMEIISGQEHPRGAHLVIVYRGEPVGGELTAGDDVDRVAFFPRDSLPPLAFKATRWALGLNK
jgi:ADP-ribose pyrophosphatase YjhB (NUDIX family)